MFLQPIIPLHGFPACHKSGIKFDICVDFAQANVESYAADDSKSNNCNHQPLHIQTHTRTDVHTCTHICTGFMAIFSDEAGVASYCIDPREKILRLDGTPDANNRN